MDFIIVRHGQTEWNVAKKIQGVTDIPLNQHGIDQAKEFAMNYDLSNIGIVYSSRLKRAMQTASIIAEYAGVDAFPMDGLEEMNLGIFEGYSWEEVRETFKEEYERWESTDRQTPIREGEGYREVAERAIAAMHQIYDKHAEWNNKKAIMIVTHSATIKALLCCIDNIPYAEFKHRYHIDNLTAVSLRVEWEGNRVIRSC